jgi:hypothetical protein
VLAAIAFQALIVTIRLSSAATCAWSSTVPGCSRRWAE